MAAIFDPFGNAVHTALTFDVVGEDVLINGAGPIGIMALRYVSMFALQSWYECGVLIYLHLLFKNEQYVEYSSAKFICV